MNNENLQIEKSQNDITINTENPSGIKEWNDIGKIEKWLPIKGFEKRYECSDSGRVRRAESKRILKGSVSCYGYRKHTLYDNQNYGKTCLCHRLIAETFIPNTDKYPQINHKDGNKLNNNLENLEWCSSKHNIQHSMSMGLSKHQTISELNNKAKLNQNQVDEIRKMYIEGDFTTQQLSKLYDVSAVNITRIINNKNWINTNIPEYDQKVKNAKHRNRSNRDCSYLHKLKDSEVIELRELYSNSKLSKMFKIDRSTVKRIVEFKCYKYVSK